MNSVWSPSLFKQDDPKKPRVAGGVSGASGRNIQHSPNVSVHIEEKTETDIFSCFASFAGLSVLIRQLFGVCCQTKRRSFLRHEIKVWCSSHISVFSIFGGKYNKNL